MGGGVWGIGGVGGVVRGVIDLRVRRILFLFIRCPKLGMLFGDSAKKIFSFSFHCYSITLITK